MSVNAATFQMRPNAQGRGVPRELWTGADELTALGIVTGVPVVGNPVLENLAPAWNLPATINVPQSDSVGVRQYLTNGAGLTISVTNLPTGVTYNSGTESLEGAASGTSSGTATFTAGSAVDTATVALVEAPASEYTPTHYVTADATGSGDGSIGSPWTLAQAMANAVAGNVVRVGPGSYTATSTSYWNPAWHPANSGTEGNPIVFFAEYPAALNAASPSLLSKLRNSSSSAATFGALGYAGGSSNHDVVYDGFWVTQADGAYPAPSNGQCVIGGGANRISILRCLFERTSLPTAPNQDNYAAIFMQQSSDHVIRDCLFRGGYSTASGHKNDAAISFYNATGVLIEHCDFEDSGCGVFFKGDRGTRPDSFGNAATVRFCRFSEITIPLAINEADATFGGCDIYQNLFVDCRESLVRWDNSSDYTGKNARVYNNTFVPSATNAENTVSVFGTTYVSEITFYNNIVLEGASQPWGLYFEANPSSTAQWDHNCYHRASGSFRFRYGSTYTGLAAWQFATTGVDDSSIEADPQFVGGGDYTLQAGSAALTASSTGGPVGCYIAGNEIIGVRT